MARRKQKALPPVKVGSVTIPRYKLGDGRIMLVDRRPDGSRWLRPFTDPTEAREEAERRARELHNGGAEAESFVAADRASYAQAKRDTAPFGLSVHAATSEWAQARAKIHGTRHSFLEIVDAGVRSLAREQHLVPEIVQELLNSKAPQDLNGRYRRGLERTLTRFAECFTKDIREISTAQIERHLEALACGPRRRDNVLAEIRHLFQFARLRGYLPDEISAARRVPTIDRGLSEISYFTIGEMRLILEHISEDWKPFVVLACFAGIRTGELCRAKDAGRSKDPLRWEDFDWQEREIYVRAETAKTGRKRIVPIHDNAFEWLRPWREENARGPIAKAERSDREFGKNGHLERAINKALQEAPRLRTERPIQLEMNAISPDAQPDLLTQFRWKNNALRHSYGSYRASIIKNIQQLADEMGNSPAMVHQHYRNPRPASQARAWFAIYPPRTAEKIVAFRKAV